MTPYYKQREEYIRSQKPSVHHGIKIDRSPRKEDVPVPLGMERHVIRGQIVRCGCCKGGFHISKIQEKAPRGVSRGKKRNEDMEFWC